MANTVQIRNSSTAAAEPSSLEAGELAINTADAKLFWEDSAGAIQTTYLLPSFDDLSSTSHASTHATGGSDAIAPADIGAAPAASPTFTGVITVAAGSAAAPAIVASGDSNTGLLFPAADTVAVSTGGVERLRVRSDGNIGIGYGGSAFHRLGVASDHASSVANFGVRSAGTAVSPATTLNSIASSPEIASGCSLSSLIHFNAAPSSFTGTASLQVGYSVSAGMNGATTNYGFRGLLPAAAGNWNVYMDGSADNFLAGNVGIGSGRTAPASALDVNGVITVSAGSAAAPAIVAAGDSNTGIAFDTDTLICSTDGNERLRIDSSGNVGIDAASPTAKLDINADTIRLRTAKTPASSSDTGNAGDICWDSSYLYICTATDTWRRIAHSTW